MHIERNKTRTRLSDSVIFNGMIFLTGQVAEDPHADITVQTQQVLARIERLLEAAGSDKSHMLKATIYLAGVGDFAAMNAVWDAWVDGDNPPARTTVEARLAAPAYKVEITVVAAVAS